MDRVPEFYSDGGGDGGDGGSGGSGGANGDDVTRVVAAPKKKGRARGGKKKRLGLCQLMSTYYVKLCQLMSITGVNAGVNVSVGVNTGCSPRANTPHPSAEAPGE